MFYNWNYIYFKVIAEYEVDGIHHLSIQCFFLILNVTITHLNQCLSSWEESYKNGNKLANLNCFCLALNQTIMTSIG